MAIYHFAANRGDDFVSEEISPINAWNNLVLREQEKGTIWRCLDEYRNRCAIERQGFISLFSDRPYAAVWREDAK